jgi:hypothetical protein
LTFQHCWRSRGKLPIRVGPAGRPNIAPEWRRSGDEIRRFAEEGL